MGRRPKDYGIAEGQVINRLLVVDADIKDTNGRTAALVLCSCGKSPEFIVRQSKLASGHTKSCGCFREECFREESLKAQSTGRPSSGRPLIKSVPHYARWVGMMSRCYNPNKENYNDYGGRGIRVHTPWHDVFVFSEWLNTNLGECPEGYTLDRIENNGDYTPGNIRWASRIEQAANKRVGAK